jgi:hypothetical protein
VVSNQAEYDAAQKIYQDILDKSYFDIDTGKGLNIVEEVDCLIYRYLYQDASKDDTEEGLSRFYFTGSQAREIAGYFSTYRPGDLYDIERGLNFLGLQNSRELNIYNSLIHIKNSTEKINVRYPVEVFGESEVEAFGHARVTAHDKSTITSHDFSIVRAFDNAGITARDQSHITARNESAVMLYDNSTAAAYNDARVTARDYSKAAVFDQVNAAAFDNCHINAKDNAYVAAHDYTRVNAQNNAVIVADTRAQVTANHHSLVFLKDDADCKCNDGARMITGSRNAPAFLKSNLFYIFDHPFINRNPVIALNLLCVSANQKNADAYSKKLKEMGCVDAESTKKALNALLDEFIYKKDTEKERSWLWER